MNDEEVGRWQLAIYDECCKAVGGLREARTIDGAGCDSGDPLDLTLTEIGQAVCSLQDEIDLLTRERDEAQRLAGEAWTAGVKLAGEMVEATDGWLVCLRDFGDLFLDLKRVEEERDEARGWAAKNDCENPRWPPVSATSESSDCGECVPCKARVALKVSGP